MNNYQDKVEAKRERYAELSAKAKAESSQRYNQAKEMASIIPFGQPIQVNHHSTNRDINFRNKIHNTFGKAFELQDKADYYADKAESYGTHSISSDDPEAITKLEEKLAELERNHELMKAANAAIRKAKTPELQIAALQSLGFTKEQANKLVYPKFAYYGQGYARFSLTNSNANIKAVKDRIKRLESKAELQTVEIVKKNYRLRQDIEENRYMFLFDGKPSDEVIKILKGGAFKWSPTRKAWVRQITGNACFAVKYIRQQLDNLTTPAS